MSTAGFGHPDWQAYANWRNLFIYNSGFTSPPSGTDFGMFVTTNYAALHIDVLSFAGDGTLELEWFADSAGTEDVDTDFLPVPRGGELNVIVPCRGNLVGISFSNAEVTDAEIFLMVAPVNNDTTLRRYIDSPLTIGEHSTTLAHSTARTMVADTIISGPAQLVFNPHDTTGKLNLAVQALNVDNTALYQIASFVGPTTQQFLQFNAPELILQYAVTNADTVSAHVYDATLTVLSQ